ncbi:MAG: trigger factor [Planctomycetes bacterium]|nr:trigger factor [Planctomycetota bacterium]
MSEQTPEQQQGQMSQWQPVPGSGEQPAAGGAVAPAGPGGSTDLPGSTLPPDKVDVADAGTLKKKVAVTVSRAKIDAKLNEMYGELTSTAQIPGFRVGHAPRRLVEKRFGKEVSQDVRNALLGESIGSAIEQAKLKTLGEPDIDLDKIKLPDSGDMTFDFEVEVAPEFELPKLEEIEVTKPIPAVTDERVDEYIHQLQTGRARYEASDMPAAEGDVVVAGAKITGEGIEPAEFHGLTLRVAPGQIEGLPLVDLGKALAGRKAEESASLTVKVPQAHPNEKWRDKELDVEIKISQVRCRILPTLDGEFAKNLGFDNINELRQYVKTNLAQRMANEVQRSMHEQICKYLTDNISFDLPEGVVARHTIGVLRRRYVDLLQRGVPKEKIDENLTELQAAASEQAKSDLKRSFILDKVAQAQQIEVGEDEVNARVAQMAAAYNRRPERLRQELASDGTLDQVRISIVEEKALDRLLAQAKITEEKPGEKDLEKPAEKTRAKAEAKAQEKAETKAAEKPAAKETKKHKEPEPEKAEKAHKAETPADREEPSKKTPEKKGEKKAAKKESAEKKKPAGHPADEKAKSSAKGAKKKK